MSAGGYTSWANIMLSHHSRGGAGGRDRPQGRSRVRWWVRPGSSRRFSLDQQEMGSRTRLDVATQRVTILRVPIAQAQGSPVREAGPWEMEQGTNTFWVPRAELKCGSWVLREKV